MVMRAMRQGALGGIVKVILFGLLMLAVCGLVFMDIGGFFRNGGIKNNDAAKIGSESLSIQAFTQDVRRNLSQMNLAPEQAYKLGYIQEMLNNEIRSALTYQAATKLGIRVGKSRIATQVSKMIQPMMEKGETPQEVLNKILTAQGMSEGELIYSMSREGSAGLMTSGIQAGFADVSDDMLNDLYLYKNETRMTNLVIFPDAAFKNVKAPDDLELQKQYEANKESYAIPERRTVTLGIIQADKIKATTKISEDDLKAAYNERLDSYAIPEQRVVEQSILKTEDEAKAVLQKVQAGTSLKDASHSVSKDELAYVHETSFEKDGLTPEVGDAVFGAPKVGDALGPIKTDLGWHVIVLKEIKPPSTKPFESVRKDLEAELNQSKISDAVYDVANAVDDATSGGRDFEQIAKENDLKIVQLGALDPYGKDANGNDALKDYAANKDLILKTAFDLGEGETSNVTEMADGTFVAVNVKTIAPKSYRDFKDVKDDLAEKWTIDQRHKGNSLNAMSLIASMKGGTVTLKDIAAKNGTAVRTIANIKRDGNPPAPLTAQTTPLMFETPVNGVTLVNLPDGVAIAQIIDSKFPKADSIDAKTLKSLHDDYIKSVQSEGMLMYLTHKQKDIGVKINQPLLESTFGPGREANEAE